MTDPAHKKMLKRADEVDARIAGLAKDGYEDAAEIAHLEKTILIAANAIVEAIWKARY